MLQPVGPQANEGLLARLWHRITGSSRRGRAWYQLESGALRTLDAGAVAGTDVYSPVDGTVVAIRDQLVSGRVVGAEIELRPTAAPSLVVALENVRPDRALSVGANVAAGSSKLGTVADIARYEKQALARFARRPRQQRVHPGLSRRRASASARAPLERPAHPLHRGRRRRPRAGGARGAPPRPSAEELEIDACVVNGENAADGVGITPRSPTGSSQRARTRSRSATTRSGGRRSARTSRAPTASSAPRTSRARRPGAA